MTRREHAQVIWLFRWIAVIGFVTGFICALLSGNPRGMFDFHAPGQPLVNAAVVLSIAAPLIGIITELVSKHDSLSLIQRIELRFEGMWTPSRVPETLWWPFKTIGVAFQWLMLAIGVILVTFSVFHLVVESASWVLSLGSILR